MPGQDSGSRCCRCCRRMPRLLPRVVERDSKIAKMSLLVAGLVFAAASIITVFRAYERRENPPVTVEILSDPFPWPSITMCLHEVLWDMDTVDLQASTRLDSCTIIAQDEDGVLREAPADDPNFYSCGGARANLSVTPTSACVTYNTTDFMANEIEDEILIKFPFNATLKPQEFFQSSEHMLVYVFPPAGTEGSGTTAFVPFEENWMVVEPSVVVPLGNGLPSVVFSAQSTWAAVEDHTDSEFPNMQHHIYLWLRSNSLKQTVVTEKDPTDIFVLVGVVAGFFSIAAGAFNFLFVTTSPDTLQAAWRVDHADEYGDDKSELEAAASVSMRPIQSSATSSTNNLAAAESAGAESTV